MILDVIKSWAEGIEINGIRYDSAQDIPSNIGKIYTIKLCHENKHGAKCLYKFVVRRYMTLKSTPDFNFMSRWNNDIPMPLVVMYGYIEKETNGMIYANLHGDVFGVECVCMKCGKELTNPVSQFFGMGPECGGHNYENPFYTEAELLEAVQKYRKTYLNNITWQGWIPKSAIIKSDVVSGEDINSVRGLR